VAVGALAIRLIYIFAIARAPVGVGGDASFYHSAANLIADGQFYYRRLFGQAFPTALHPPLYPLALSVVSLLGGVQLLAHRIVGVVVGSASVVLIGVLGRRLGGPRTGLIAAAIAAVYPPLVTADGAVMSEPLYVLLLLIALLLAARRPSWRGCVVLGAVIGLGILTRTEAALLLPLLAWPVAMRSRHGAAVRVVAATAAAALVVAPWVIRNEVVFHRPLLAANYETVLSAANCHATYYGHNIGWWSLGCLARARTYRQFVTGDASPRPGLRYIGRHPARAALVAGVRVLRTFSFFQPLRIGNAELRRRWVDAAGLFFYYPMLILAGLGLCRLRGRRWLLLAPVCAALLTGATGWGNSRFRIGADVSLVVLAATGVTGRLRRPPAPAPAG
jgi:4-amino-4-deoxy-L-arabinose transferase-like glycosyltransferase